jgi:hypothetical protein
MSKRAAIVGWVTLISELYCVACAKRESAPHTPSARKWESVRGAMSGPCEGCGVHVGDEPEPLAPPAPPAEPAPLGLPERALGKPWQVRRARAMLGGVRKVSHEAVHGGVFNCTSHRVGCLDFAIRSGVEFEAIQHSRLCAGCRVEWCARMLESSIAECLVCA